MAQTNSGPAARLVGAVVAAVSEAPGIVLGAYALAIAASIWAATGLGVDTDSSKMLSPDLPFQSRALELREAFPDQKTAMLVVVRAPDADRADLATAEIVEKLQDAPGIESVFAPAIDPFFQQNGMLYLSVEEFGDQMTRISESANLIAGLRADQTLGGFLSAIDQARRLAEGGDRSEDLDTIYAEAARVLDAAAAGRTEPFGWSAAFSGEQGEGPVLRVINISPSLDYTLLNPAKPALRAIEAVIAGIAPQTGVEIGITGDPALRAEELRSVTAKIFWSLGLSLVFVALVLWLALGTVARALLGLGALLATLILTTGFAAAAVGSLNLISIAFIVLMVGLGIDFAIHFLAHLDEKAARGQGPALAETGRSIGPALLLAAGSTALAFLAFTTTDFVGMAQLGLIGGIGVLIAFAVSITLIPAVVALRPGLARGQARGPRRLRAGGVPGKRVIAPMLALAGVMACWWAVDARFDADPMNLRDPDAGSVQSFGWLIAQPGLSPLRVAVLAQSPQEAAQVASTLQGLETVDTAIWLGDLVPQDQLQKLDLLDLAWPSLQHAAEGSPEDLTESRQITPERLAEALTGGPKSAGAQALAEALTAYASAADPLPKAGLEQALFASFPLLQARLSAMLQMDEVTEQSLPTPLASRYSSADGRYLVEILPKADIRDAVARSAFVLDVQAQMAEATGAPAQIEGATTTVSRAMIQAVLIAGLGASLLALITLRSLLGTAAIVLPVALAGAVCMAASVLLDIPFNYANVIVLPLIIGIGVDTGIHLALRVREEGSVFDTATPMAAFYSALTTIAAFGTLGLSDHRGTASMGILLAIGLCATVIMCFALTPPLARMIHRKS
ncbi:MAG: MMPL family transporter [Pseudomonadota bacterium]